MPSDSAFLKIAPSFSGKTTQVSRWALRFGGPSFDYADYPGQQLLVPNGSGIRTNSSWLCLHKLVPHDAAFYRFQAIQLSTARLFCPRSASDISWCFINCSDSNKNLLCPHWQISPVQVHQPRPDSWYTKFHPSNWWSFRPRPMAVEPGRRQTAACPGWGKSSKPRCKWPWSVWHCKSCRLQQEERTSAAQVSNWK